MTKTIWVDTTGASTTYVPREKPIQESVAPFSGTISGAAPATTNLGTNSGQRILAADGTWIPQPAFTSGGADQLETLRPSVISTSYSANPPTVTDSAKAYDSDTNHATTFGQWYAAQEARTNNRVDIFSLTTWASKTQTWTAATINVSRSYAILQDGESASVDGLSSKTSSVKYEFSTNNGSSWTTLGTDTQSSIPTAPQTLSMALGTLTPTMGNILIKVTITRGGGGTIYEDGVSLPGLTGEVDLKLFDVWIDGTYAGGAGNITCNNLTVTGDATFQNKIYDSTASAGTTGQVLKVAANGKVTWATDSAGTGTVTSITTTGANGVTISGGSTQTITTSGTFALALGNITPTSISTGTGSFSGDVEFAASIKSPNGSNSPVTIVPDGTGDLHVNADSLRLGDNNADATIATNGTGDLILTTHEGSATQGIIRLYDGANGNITLTPNGTGQVQVGTDQVVTLAASQTLTNKSISGSTNTFSNIPNSATTATSANTASAIVARDASGNFSAGTITATLSGNATNVTGTVAVANGGTGSTTLTSGSYLVGAGTSAVTLKTPTQVTADLDTFTYQIGGTAGKKGLVPAAPPVGTIVYLDNSGNWSTPTESGVSSFSAGTTGFTPSSATTGAVTLAGTLNVANGGTGLTTLTAGYIPYGNGTSAFGSSANLFWDSTNSRLGIGTSSPASRLHVYTAATNKLTLDSPTANDNRLDFAKVGTVKWSMYSPANSNDLRMYDHQTVGDVVTFQSGGNVGIGTSSPSAPIHIQRSNDGTIGIFRGTSNAQLLLSVASGNLVYDASNGNATHVFQTNSTERMRIDSNGNVGIGTSTVVANFGGYKTLELNGTTGGLLSLDSNGTNNLQMYTNGSTVNVVTIGALPLTFGTNSTERMRIDSSGNVGIGVSSTTFRLDVQGSSSGYLEAIRFKNTNSAGYLTTSWTVGSAEATIRYAPGSFFKIGPDSGDTTSPVVFATNNGTERMRITSGGDVCIGTTSASGKLHIAGSTANLVLSGTSNSYVSVNVNSSNIGYLGDANWMFGGSSSDFGIRATSNLVFGTSFYERMRIDSSGNVGIGVASPSKKLQVNGGDIYLSTAGSSIWFAATSDSGDRLRLHQSGGNAYIDWGGGTIYFRSGASSSTARMDISGSGVVTAAGMFCGNSGAKGFGAITTTTTTSTPTGGSSGDHYYIY